jgi:hypothetical protein
MMKRWILFLAAGVILGTGAAWSQSVNNNDFEGASLASWTVDSTDPNDGWGIASGFSHPGGMFSARCRRLYVGGSDHYIYQAPSGLSPDVTYRVNAWIQQGLNAGSARFGWFLVDGTPLSTVTVTNGEFWQFSAEDSFSSGELATGVVVRYEWINANGEAFFDTVTIDIAQPMPTPTVTSTPTPTWTPWVPVTGVDSSWMFYR